jgi:hypothetical protein
MTRSFILRDDIGWMDVIPRVSHLINKAITDLITFIDARHSICNKLLHTTSRLLFYV